MNLCWHTSSSDIKVNGLGHIYLAVSSLVTVAVIDLFSVAIGGLSQKPGQVCDSGVKRTVHMTTGWQTHIQRGTGRLYTDANRRRCPVCVFRPFVVAVAYHL